MVKYKVPTDAPRSIWINKHDNSCTRVSTAHPVTNIVYHLRQVDILNLAALILITIFDMSVGLRIADTEKSLYMKMASTPATPSKMTKVVDDYSSSDYASSIYLEKEKAQKRHSKWASFVNSRS
jgi:hypothetical protein